MNNPLKQVRNGTITSLLAVMVLLAVVPRAHAQLGDAGELLRAGTHDANLLMESYLKPFGAGFGADLNTGWINTAHPHQRFGFELRANAALAIVPSSDQLFSLSDLAFEQINTIQGGPTTPTISGDEITGPRVGQTIMVDGQPTELFGFEMPQGIGFPYVPAPMVQLTVGTGFNTDLSLRLFPSMEIGDVGTVSLWGIGARHALNQWIPGGEALPVDLAVQLGYTSLTTTASFDVQPQVDAETEVPSGYGVGAARWDNQSIEMDANGFTGNLLFGRSFPVLSLYGGIGFQSSNMNISTPGNYPVTVPNEDAAGEIDPDRPRRIHSIADPIDLSIGGSNTVHAMAGFRIRLAIISISGSYTLGNYSVANVGVGISIR